MQKKVLERGSIAKTPNLNLSVTFYEVFALLLFFVTTLFVVGGFLYVDEILGKPRFKKYTVDDVKSVVESNEKQRFYMETDADSGRFKIRANQGHTLEVIIIKPQLRIQ
jgi:hypothetical protein